MISKRIFPAQHHDAMVRLASVKLTSSSPLGKINLLKGRAPVATRMGSMSPPSEYVLEAVRKGADFILYRGRQHGNPSPVLGIALSAEQPSPQSLRRLEHEYSLAAELDPAWAARPLALTRHEGRTILVLKDPGGEPLDRVLERDQAQPLDLTRVLRIAIGLATTTRPSPPAWSDLQNPHYNRVALRPALVIVGGTR